MKAYKVLEKNLCSCHGGKAKWTVGCKKSVKGDLVPCKNGIHVCRDERDLLSWLGEVICPCEHSDEYIDHDNKRVVRWARIGEPNPYWDERTARHFACDCAEYVLQYAQDDQCELLQAVIDITRAYADWPEEWGAASAAAWAAAADAARVAAWGAARDAARAAARAIASDAAWGAASDAAADAARVAAWGAARDAARDAARVAAWGAARDAARVAAWDAARAAASDAAADAAADAARAAAWDAAWDDLAAILATYLDGTIEWVTKSSNANTAATTGRGGSHD